MLCTGYIPDLCMTLNFDTYIWVTGVSLVSFTMFLKFVGKIKIFSDYHTVIKVTGAYNCLVYDCLIRAFAYR